LKGRPEAVVLEAVRTPIGKYGGILKGVRPDDLAALMIRELLGRSKVDPAKIDDIYLGASNQAGEDNRNVARMAALLSGLPYSVPGATVNRLCGSGLEAVNDAARVIWAGEGDVLLAGGVVGIVLAGAAHVHHDGGTDETIERDALQRPASLVDPPLSMGETAENLAEKYRISRERQDEFAYNSHMKAVRAIDDGMLEGEVVPTPTPDHADGVKVDEGPRRDTTIEKLATLKPVFRKNGTVTAGNSSGINDGAAGLLITSRDAADSLSAKPIARILGTATAGVHPSYMGLGPVPATRKLLSRLRMGMDEFGIVELNEAFAAQVLACMEEMPEFNPERMNPNGGAVALGHPIGCSGARIAVTLLHEMKRTKTRFGMATMCIGVGQGIATAFELT